MTTTPPPVALALNQPPNSTDRESLAAGPEDLGRVLMLKTYEKY